MVTSATYYSDMHYGDGPRQAVVGILVPAGAVPAAGYTLVVNWSTGSAGSWTDGMPRLYLTPVGTSMNTAQTQVDTGTEVEVVPDSYVAGTDPGGAAAWVATYTLPNAMVAPYANTSTDPAAQPCLALRTNFAKTPFSFTTWRSGDWITLPTTGSFVGNSGPMAQVTEAGGGGPTLPVLTTLGVSPLPDGRLLTLVGTDLADPTAVTMTVAGTDYPLTVVGGDATSITVSGGWPSTDDGAITGTVTVTTAAGTSNTLSLTVNPPELQPSAGGGGGGATGHATGLGGTAFMLGSGPRSRRAYSSDGTPYAEHKAAYTRTTPSLVLAGLAVREPAMAGVSSSSGQLTAPEPAEGLRDATVVQLGADWRWLPRDADYHDDGAGSMVWDPISGTKQWAGVTGQLPYLDPAFPLPTAHGEITAGAMVFDGGAWLQLPLVALSQFTVALVVRPLHSHTSSFYDMLASPSSATDRVKAVDLTLRYRGAATHLWSGHRRYLDDELRMWSRGSTYKETIKRRPVILVWSQTSSHVRYHRLDALGHRSVERKLKDAPISHYDLNFYLGRSGNAYDPDGCAHMQVFDLAIWRDAALSNVKLAGVARKLNSIYGVHR